MEPAAISASPPGDDDGRRVGYARQPCRERKGNCQPVRHADHDISDDLGTGKVSLDVRCLWHRFYSSFNCAMIVFKTRADWHMASVSCGFRSIRNTHSTPPWLRATGKLRQTPLMPQ